MVVSQNHFILIYIIHLANMNGILGHAWLLVLGRFDSCLVFLSLKEVTLQTHAVLGQITPSAGADHPDYPD